MLSPPEGYLAAKSGAGTVLVSLGDDFPLLADQPYLVLVAKKPIDDKASELIVKTARALQAASTALVKEPDADRAGDPEAILRQGRPGAIVRSRQGDEQRRRRRRQTGRAEPSRTSWLFSKEVGTNFGKDFDAAAIAE